MTTTEQRRRLGSQAAAVLERVRERLRLSGFSGTAKLIASTAAAMVRFDASYVWYELDLRAELPQFPLDDRFKLRRATEDDLGRFAEIPPVTAYTARARMEAGADLWYASDGDAIAFFCWILRDAAPTVLAPTGSIRLPSGIVNLEDSTALPEYRRTAVGLGTIAQVLGLLRDQGLSSVVTTVATDNQPARRWVLKLGFVEVCVAGVRRRGRRLSRTVAPTPSHESSWLVKELSD
jgi:ribosomal protein S18 acetylase RimI-like enzyme